MKIPFKSSEDEWEKYKDMSISEMIELTDRFIAENAILIEKCNKEIDEAIEKDKAKNK
jgi:hypothetical protein